MVMADILLSGRIPEVTSTWEEWLISRCGVFLLTSVVVIAWWRAFFPIPPSAHRFISFSEYVVRIPTLDCSAVVFRCQPPAFTNLEELKLLPTLFSPLSLELRHDPPIMFVVLHELREDLGEDRITEVYRFLRSIFHGVDQLGGQELQWFILDRLDQNLANKNVNQFNSKEGLSNILSRCQGGTGADANTNAVPTTELSLLYFTDPSVGGDDRVISTEGFFGGELVLSSDSPNISGSSMELLDTTFVRKSLRRAVRLCNNGGSLNSIQNGGECIALLGRLVFLGTEEGNSTDNLLSNGRKHNPEGMLVANQHPTQDSSGGEVRAMEVEEEDYETIDETLERPTTVNEVTFIQDSLLDDQSMSVLTTNRSQNDHSDDFSDTFQTSPVCKLLCPVGRSLGRGKMDPGTDTITPVECRDYYFRARTLVMRLSHMGEEKEELGEESSSGTELGVWFVHWASSFKLAGQPGRSCLAHAFLTSGDYTSLQRIYPSFQFLLEIEKWVVLGHEVNKEEGYE